MARPSKPEDTPSGRYLQLCQELIDRVGAMRNFGMRKHDVWLAKGELNRIVELTGELQALLEEIKTTDT